MKFLRTFLNKGNEPAPAPAEPEGMTLAEIASSLHLPQLQAMVDSGKERHILSVSKNGETETLRFEPEHSTHHNGTPVPGKAFALCIDVKSACVNPTLSLSFKEVADGRFKVSESWVTHHETLNQIKLPTLENAAIDAVAERVWQHRASLSRPNHNRQEPS